MRLSGLLLAVVCGPALAASYHVSGGVGANLGGGSSVVDEYDIANGIPVAGIAGMNENDGATVFQGTAASAASAAGLSAYATTYAAEVMDAGPVGKQSSAIAFASMTFTDVVVSGGPAGSFTPTSINADLSGSFAAANTLSALSRGQVQVVFLVDGVNIGGGFRVFEASAATSATTSSGVLVGWTSGGTITSPGFNVKVGTPFQVELQLSAASDSNGAGNEMFASLATADFSHTLTFAQHGPVFNLAAGLTADSAEAGIVGNALAPVAEPPAALLALLGLAALGLHRRR